MMFVGIYTVEVFGMMKMVTPQCLSLKPTNRERLRGLTIQVKDLLQTVWEWARNVGTN
jgi:hypothetical protein